MALVEGKPIINPSWITAVLECNSGSALPNVDEYIDSPCIMLTHCSFQPPKSKGLTITDTDIFRVNPLRKTLFKGLTFVFLTSEQVTRFVTSSNIVV